MPPFLSASAGFLNTFEAIGSPSVTILLFLGHLRRISFEAGLKEATRRPKRLGTVQPPPAETVENEPCSFEGPGGGQQEGAEQNSTYHTPGDPDGVGGSCVATQDACCVATQDICCVAA